MSGLRGVALFGALELTGLIAMFTTALPWWTVIASIVFLNAAISSWWLFTRRGESLYSRSPQYQLVPELVLLPLAASFRQSTSIQLALLGTIAALALIRARNKAQHEKYVYVPAALLLLCVALTFRDGRFLIGGMLVAIGAILWILTTAVSRANAYMSMLAGISLYLAANVVGWAAGIKSPATAVRIGGYETSSGFFSERVLFPFARSINDASYVGAGLIVAVAVMVRLRQRPPWFLWFGVTMGAFIIVASNSRTPLLMAMVVTAALVSAPRATRMVAPYAVTATLLLPFLLGKLQPLAMSFAELLASSSYMSRGQDADQLLSMGGRGEIWNASVTFWTHRVNDLSHLLIGFGSNGHFKSGASSYYPPELSNFLRDKSALTTHNSTLQMLFDAGLLGAATLLGLVFFLIRSYGSHSELLPVLGVALMIGLSGTVEASLAPGMNHMPVLILLILLVFAPKSIAVKENMQKGGTLPRTSDSISYSPVSVPVPDQPFVDENLEVNTEHSYLAKRRS